MLQPSGALPSATATKLNGWHSSEPAELWCGTHVLVTRGGCVHTHEQNIDLFASDKAKQLTARLQSSLLQGVPAEKSFSLWGESVSWEGAGGGARQS